MYPVILAAPTNFDTLLACASDVFEAIIANVATVGSTIVSDPVLLLFTLIGVGSLAIGWFKSLLRG